MSDPRPTDVRPPAERINIFREEDVCYWIGRLGCTREDLTYAVKKIGIDHVGISSDFDGGGGIDGWNSAAETFNVTLELVRRGYIEEQIGKIWSGNLLRVMDKVQAVAKQLQGAR